MNSNTSYEDSKACKMVATSCACCSRPLVDSVSVETGVGPVCRKRHGFNDAQTSPNWAKASSFVSGISEAEGQRKAANVLVHHIAVDQTGEHVGRMVCALFALGFQKLSGIIAERVGSVTVTQEGGLFSVKAPYSDHLTSGFRVVPGRRWDAKNKVNTFPVTSQRALWDCLKARMPKGTLVIGAKGISTL